MSPSLPAESLEKLFVDVVRGKVPSDVADRVFRNFLAQGMDPLLEVDDQRHNVLEAWWYEGGGEYNRSPPAATVAEVAARHPEVWTHTSGYRERQTLGQRVLERLGAGNTGADAGVLADWLRVLPLPELVAHRHRHDDRKPRSPGETLFIHVLGLHSQDPVGSAAAVDALRARGLKMSSPSVGTCVNTEEQWAYFLKDGGNPDELVRYRDEQRVPVWHVARDHAAPSGIAAVEAWAKEHRAQGLAAEEDREYWATLDRYATSGDLQKNARARANWPTLTDPNGATVLMHLAKKSAPALQALAKTSKAWVPPARLDAEDTWGRNLWAYAWGNNHLDGAIVSLLLDNKVLPGPNAAGEGLVQQCIVNGVDDVRSPGRCFSEHEFARTSNPAWVKKLAHTLGEEGASQALWGNQASMDTLGQHFRMGGAYWGSQGSSPSRSQLIALLAYLASECPPVDPSPSLRGALAYACFMSNNPALGVRFLDEGPALTEVSPDHAAVARAWLKPDAVARLEAANMASNLPDSSTRRPRARM